MTQGNHVYKYIYYFRCNPKEWPIGMNCPRMEGWSLNHWTAREILSWGLYALCNFPLNWVICQDYLLSSPLFILILKLPSSLLQLSHKYPAWSLLIHNMLCHPLQAKCIEKSEMSLQTLLREMIKVSFPYHPCVIKYAVYFEISQNIISIMRYKSRPIFILSY